MKTTICREPGGLEPGVLRSLLESSPFTPLRYLKEVPPQRLRDYWQAEVDAVLGSPFGAALVTEVDGRGAGLCVLGDLPWESGILAKKMAAVKHLAVGPGKNSAAVLETLLERALKYAKDGGYEFLLCKSYTDDFKLIHALENQGFLLVDTNLDFVVNLQEVSRAAEALTPLPKEIELRIASEPDRQQLVEISRAAFSDHFGRFHADQRLGPEVGRTIYERWIEACLDGWADWIVVAEVAGRVCGYSAWKRPSGRETEHQLGLGHYSIGAIHPDFYGRGLFSALTYKGMSLFDGGATRVEGPTHVNNYPVQRGYQKLGWRIEDARHSFHKWLTA